MTQGSAIVPIVAICGMMEFAVVSHLEESLNRRSPGRRILTIGITIAGLGALPLLLYVVLGPKDGNPIGLGPLAFFAVPAGIVVAAVGLIKMLVQYFKRPAT